MKPRISNQRNRGLTILDIFVIIACLVILAAFFLPLLARRRTCQRVSCVRNIKQVNLALRIWEGDNNNLYPMGVSVTNGGGLELIATGNVAGCLQVVSNELSTPKILICPGGSYHTFATNFQNDFNNSHISYFFGVDVTNEDNPRIILDGDDSFAIAGVAVKSGLLEIFSNTPISWTKSRHYPSGNIGFADGSVQEVPVPQLQKAFQQTGLATNRLAIP